MRIIDLHRGLGECLLGHSYYHHHFPLLVQTEKSHLSFHGHTWPRLRNEREGDCICQMFRASFDQGGCVPHLSANSFPNYILNENSSFQILGQKDQIYSALSRLYYFYFIYLFMRDTHTQRQRHRQREKQTPGIKP